MNLVTGYPPPHGLTQDKTGSGIGEELRMSESPEIAEEFVATRRPWVPGNPVARIKRARRGVILDEELPEA